MFLEKWNGKDGIKKTMKPQFFFFMLSPIACDSFFGEWANVVVQKNENSFEGVNQMEFKFYKKKTSRFNFANLLH